MLLHDLVLSQASTNGDGVALIRGDSNLTYREFGENLRSIASGLRSLGIRPGERIAVCMNKRVEAVVSYYAVSHADAIFVPINPVLKPNQIRHILDDCTVSILITSAAQARLLDGHLDSLKALRRVLIVEDDWDSLLQESPQSTHENRRIDNDAAAIFYTSGSTGKPKGVVLSHRNLTVGASSVASYLENTSDDVILSALPLSFDAGFSQTTTGFHVGAKVVLLDYVFPLDVPKAIAKHQATALTGVPPLWNQLKDVEWPIDAVDSLRYIANTGGAMPTATLSALRKLLPKTKVFLMYGLTESFRSTYLPPSEIDRRPTSMGKAIPNAEVFVLREDGTDCEPGEPGELVHRGALVSMGYWNDPDRTAARFRPLPNQPDELVLNEIAVWSGDTVTADEDGFLYFVGRKDDMIKSSGYRISPTEIEEVVHGTGLVSECVALGLPHPDIGQEVVVVANATEATDATSNKVLMSCRKSLATFMVPSRIIWMTTLPRNPNGKIDRKKIASEISETAKRESK